MTFKQPPIQCPECSATGGLHTLSCSQYAHTNEPTRRLTDADLATLKGLVPWQWENWLDPYERGMPLCDVTQRDLRGPARRDRGVPAWQRRSARAQLVVEDGVPAPHARTQDSASELFRPCNLIEGPDAEPVLGSAVPVCRLITDRLELRPLPALAAAALPADRVEASRIIGATLPVEWPLSDLLDVLPLQAAASPQTESFGVWVMIERKTETIVGDIGFIGPPDDSGVVEVGYSVIPDRRRRGYATEAGRMLVEWVLAQPNVQVVVAGCDSDNVPSVRTLERLGFGRTGEANGQIRWRDHDPARQELIAS